MLFHGKINKGLYPSYFFFQFIQSSLELIYLKNVLDLMHYSVVHGEMAEWLKATASKAVIPGDWDRGFESRSLLQASLQPAHHELVEGRLSRQVMNLKINKVNKIDEACPA